MEQLGSTNSAKLQLQQMRLNKLLVLKIVLISPSSLKNLLKLIINSLFNYLSLTHTYHTLFSFHLGLLSHNQYF